MLKSWWKRPDSLSAKFNSRGRSAVLWGVVMFLALQAAYYYPLAHIWPQLQDLEYGDKMSRLRTQLAAKSADQPCVVALGSSLTAWGFNPAALTSVKAGSPGGPVVFDFGINSGGVIVELMCLRRILDDGIRPDLIVLETHPQFLFREFNTVPGKHYLQPGRFQVRDAEVLSRYDPEWRELRHEWRATQWFAWFSNRYNIQQFLVPRWGARPAPNADVWPYIDRNGWECMPRILAWFTTVPKEVGVQSVRHRIHNLNHSPMEDCFKLAYREIIDLCHQHGTEVVLVRMPEMSHALVHYTPELKRQVDDFYAGLVRDTGIRFVDAKDWVEDQHFPDAFHLHPVGATIFMQRLEREFLGEFFARHGGSAGRRVAALSDR
jgi:hypothetical protein